MMERFYIVRHKRSVSKRKTIENDSRSKPLEGSKGNWGEQLKTGLFIPVVTEFVFVSRSAARTRTVIHLSCNRVSQSTSPIDLQSDSPIDVEVNGHTIKGVKFHNPHPEKKELPLFNPPPIKWVAVTQHLNFSGDHHQGHTSRISLKLAR